MEMFIRLVFLAILTTSLCACEKEGHDSVTSEDIAHAMEKLSFACTPEADHLPTVNDDAQALYRYALFLQSREGGKNFDYIARYYRLAYAAGSYIAATNLHALISEGLIESNDPENEVINIVEDLIARDIPGGYYDMGHYLETGYGVKQDTSRANTYFRRAADLGNADAQYYVSNLLEEIEDAKQVVFDMRRCAMDQGHAEAAYSYGIFQKARDIYPEAVQGFQAGVRNGSSNSAGFLSGGFKTTEPKNRLYYFALEADTERSMRYEKIESFLSRYEHLGPKVPDIDQIVPLPPAKLPEWDGTFEWLKKRESTPPAEKPSEDMIRALSQEKGLDPTTGMPLAAVKK
ncbi:putative lipoprotein [Pseudomonas amygdali pv. morsprunorum]|nr:putative lipoprotein [Pseudomonas amygdali pv. morsprunorum]